MELTSLQAHHLGGLAALAVGAGLALAEAGVVPRAWPRYVAGGALLVWGLRSMTHPFPAGVETSAGAEAGQHILIGVAAALTGAIECLRATGRLRHAGLDLLLPLGLVVLGALFFRHAQHDAAAAPLVLEVQHRIFAVTLWLAALARAAALRERLERFHAAFALLVVLFGAELLLYTEGAAHVH